MYQNPWDSPPRPDCLKLIQFINLYSYSMGKPDNVSDARWSGMVRWWETRKKEGYDIEEVYRDTML
jgi:hypothetical protein